jgi:subtilisin family serine protease
MMNAITSVVLLLAMLLTGSRALAADNVEENVAIEATRASRTILVGFVDRSINRKATGTAGNHYQRRGVYNSSTWGKRVAGQISESYRLKQINAWPITELGIYCVVYEVAGNESVDDVLKTLQRDDRIKLAQPMSMYHTMASHYSDPYFRLQNNLQTMQIEAAHRRATGRAIKIAVIDTGIDLEHPDLQGLVSAHQDFTGNEGNHFSGELHGTAVAGVIGARADNGKGIVGVAPNAEIMAFKACWQTEPNSMAAVCNSLTLALALNTAIRMKPHILNLSLTGPPDPLLRQLLEHAQENGIIVVAAAADEAGATSGFPASMEHVIAAYTATQAGNDKEPGAHPQRLSAPGVEILTTFPHDTYNFMSGSSIAAAQISGVIALLLELRPDLASDEIVKILGDSAASGQNGSDMGFSVVNAEAAIEQLSGVKYVSSNLNIFLIEP